MAGFERRQLGKTGLWVSPLGIGGGHGISSPDLLYAFERGINYFFFSSDLHHFTYRQSVEALQKLCAKGSAVRQQIVLSTVSYINDPEKIFAVLLDQFAELGVEYIDIFHWGWITDDTPLEVLLTTARQLQDGESAVVLNFRQIMQQVNSELVKRGLVRYVGASFHSRRMARTYLPQLDVVMLRYNLGHIGAERDVFPYLAEDKTQNPGVVAFNVAHRGNLFLSQPPPGYPPGLPVPSIPDCYRFALSQPQVDLVLTGMNRREQIDAALAALEKGAMCHEECEFLRGYGAVHAGRQPLSSLQPTPVAQAQIEFYSMSASF
jgi:aryl-alcohol dehydrogenase-like predicted oxidoreductase